MTAFCTSDQRTKRRYCTVITLGTGCSGSCKGGEGEESGSVALVSEEQEETALEPSQEEIREAINQLKHTRSQEKMRVHWKY